MPCAHEDRPSLLPGWISVRKGRQSTARSRATEAPPDQETAWLYRSPNGTVSECCHPSVAIDAQNNVYVMFRNVIAGSRDLYLARSTDGGQSFSPATKLGSGTWQLNACPMDGGGVAVGSDGTPVAIWRRGRDVFTASDDRSGESVGSGKDPSLQVGRAREDSSSGHLGGEAIVPE